MYIYVTVLAMPRFEVEKILNIREDDDGGSREFLIKWVGTTIPTWEPEENLDKCQDALTFFLEVHMFFACLLSVVSFLYVYVSGFGVVPYPGVRRGERNAW